jgi:hypothetical protein
LAYQQGRDPDANAKRNQPRVQPAPGINDRRVVLRHIHHLGIHRLNRIVRTRLHLNLLLRRAAQRPRVIRLCPQPLDRLRNHILVGQHGRTNGGIVVDVLRHHLHHRRESRQRDKGRIEPLLLRPRRQLRQGFIAVLRQPVIEVENLLRIGSSRGDLCQKGIGIKRDRRQQLIQLLRRRRRRHLRLEIRSHASKDQESDQEYYGGQTRGSLHAQKSIS